MLSVPDMANCASLSHVILLNSKPVITDTISFRTQVMKVDRRQPFRIKATRTNWSSPLSVRHDGRRTPAKRTMSSANPPSVAWALPSTLSCEPPVDFLRAKD
eukprot:4219463-Prymnesium_polylepis.1